MPVKNAFIVTNSDQFDRVLTSLRLSGATWADHLQAESRLGQFGAVYAGQPLVIRRTFDQLDVLLTVDQTALEMNGYRVIFDGRYQK